MTVNSFFPLFLVLFLRTKFYMSLMLDFAFIFFFEDCVYYLSSKFGICCLKLYFIELYRKGWKYK